MGKTTNAKTVRNITIGGWHPIKSALNNPARHIEKLYSTESALPMLERILKDMGKEKIYPIEIITLKEMDNLWKEPMVHQGVACIIHPLPEVYIEDIIMHINKQAKEHALIIVLDQVQDPRNIGAIARSAVAFGATAILMQDKHSPQESETMAKASAGALEIIPIIRVINITQTLVYLKKQGFWIIALDGRSKENIRDAKKWEKKVLILGAEGKGIRPLVQEQADITLKIPINPAMESLNVSSAASIALYEFTTAT